MANDKGCLMNVVMKRCAVGVMSPDDEVMVVKSSTTNKIVHYQKMKKTPRLQIPVASSNYLH